MANIKIIEDLSNAFGPSGFEEDVSSLVKKYCSDMNCESDAMHNVIVRMKNHDGKKPVILLDAHTDEVGFIVQHIKSNGLISFLYLGSWIASNIPAHIVRIKNSKGEFVRGIITSKPPHLMSDAELNERTSNIVDSIYIDVGASSYKEVVDVFGIKPGDPVAPDVTFVYNEKTKMLLGKSFDDRIGCHCVIETLKRLFKEADLYVDVVGGFASQEEIIGGYRGAYVISQVIKPDLAIVFEGPPADDVYLDKYESQGRLKGGAQMSYFDPSYIGNREFLNYAKNLAEKNNIKYQCSVHKRGGTNAAVIHISNKAVPSLIIGVPTRYIHTHYNYCAEADIDAAIDLATVVVKNLNKQVLHALNGQQG
jgi:putative aminopeptidase FrvX